MSESSSRATALEPIRQAFARSSIATGLLAISERGGAVEKTVPAVFRQALGAGCAVAIGTAAAASLREKRYTATAMVVAAGIVLAMTAADDVKPMSEGIS